jgi:hypothetical protein
MPRLIKFAVTGFVVYAVVTASPAHQAEIGRGLLAIKDAAVDACTRENSPCTIAVTYAVSTLSGVMSDQPAPWMDNAQSRSSSTSQTALPPQRLQP